MGKDVGNTWDSLRVEGIIAARKPVARCRATLVPNNFIRCNMHVLGHENISLPDSLVCYILISNLLLRNTYIHTVI